jgi:hypothetical protein
VEIPRIDAALLRITTETARAAPSLALSVGQRLTGRVLSAGDGSLHLDLQGRHVQARSTVPLTPGQRIDVEVIGLGPEISMRLLDASQGVSEHQLALATLATAHRPAPGDLGALWRVIAAQSGQVVSTDLRAALARLLGGVAADTPVDRLTALIKDVLENSGLLFESRVRSWLMQAGSADAGAPRSGAALPPAVAADLKVLLGLLRRALQVPLPGESEHGETGPPAAGAAARSAGRGDAVRQQIERWLSAGAPSRQASGPDRGEFAQLRDAVLARQVETAYHWVRNGTLAIDLPLRFGGQEVTARLRFRRPREDSGRRGSDPPAAPGAFWFDFALAPPGLGAVRAQVELAPSRLGLRFIVERADVAALIEQELPALATQLSRCGLGPALATVEHDPARAAIEAMPEPVVPRGGSILDTRV